MPKIFVSYRRADLPDLVDRIFDHLSAHFGKHEVFRDIDDVEPSAEFAKKIGDALRECRVIVALIGPNWLAISADGQRGIDKDDDWVRTELSTGLTINLPIVPVTLNRATLPAADTLPNQMRSLIWRQALQLESGRTFSMDVGRLISAVSQYVPEATQASDKTGPSRTWFAAFLSIGKLKIAFSIVAMTLLVSVGTIPVIRDIIPEITRTAKAILNSDDSYAALFTNPRQTEQTVASVQRALCVPSTELGNIGSLTLNLAEIYKQTAGEGQQHTPDPSARLAQTDVVKLLSAGPCPQGYKNYFERKAFPHSIVDSGLISLLNKVDGSSANNIPPNPTESQVRLGVKSAREALGLMPSDPALADQITPDLLQKLENRP